MCSDLRDFRYEFHIESDNLKLRMSALEAAMIGLKRDLALGDEADARQQLQIDQIIERIRRIEKRLDLA